MTKQEFLENLYDQLEWSSPLTFETDIKDNDEWDSLSAMILTSYVREEFDLALSPDDLLELTTMESLINKIGPDRFD